MLQSLQQISNFVGSDRTTIIKRAEQFGLEPVAGKKQAKLYDTRKLVQLIPQPTRATDLIEEGASTLEEARIRQTLADARLKELSIKKEEGYLADVTELMELQNALFDDIAARIKKSSLSDSEKEDLLDSIVAAARNWAES
tara:strand:+ start:937 stop:1359 length:423 start_codon:yes stop_codon:yes gene_type:complete